MKKSFYLQVLWERGLSGLWEKGNYGLIFHCYSHSTSVVLSQFFVYGKDLKATNETTEEEDHWRIDRWDIIAPYGSVLELSFSDWNVGVIVTPFGPMEIWSEWLGGGDSCYQGYGIYPSGREINSTDFKTFPATIKKVAKKWKEGALQQLTYGDIYLRMWKKEE